MHVIVDAHLAIKNIDGISRYLIGLLSQLPQVDGGVEYSILSLPEDETGLPDKIFDLANVRRVEFNLHGLSPMQHLKTGRVVRALGGDVYHHPHFDLPMGVQVPAVITIHDLKYVANRAFFTERSRLKSWYIRRSLSSALRRADRIIAVSNHTRDDLLARFGLNAGKTTVIHHGVAPPRDSHDSSGLHLPEEYILFVGSRRPHKNIVGLIEALAILHHEHGLKTPLVIAGKPYADYTEPERTTQRLGLNSSVRFLNFVPEYEMAALYKRASVLVLPSYYEGFGLPVLEAMNHETPVVVSNVTSLPEVTGDSGLLVDPQNPEDIAEKLKTVLTSRKLRSRLIEKGKLRAQQFTWEAVAKATLDVYITALKNSKKQ